MPSGYASPCPVFSISPGTLAQSGTLTLSATPQAGTDYIYTTAYYAQGTQWLPTTLQGNNAAPSYSSGPASGALNASSLSSLPIGTNYVVLWDWLWDSTAGCYKGPGLNQCNAGTWRLQTFTLTQSTSGPAVSISPTSLTFPSTQVGMTSAPQTFTVTNVGNATLTIALGSDTISGDFNFGGVGTCATSLAVGASCTYSANFTPTAVGTRTGQEVIFNNAPNSPQTVTLTGVGASSNVTPTPSTSPTSCTSGCNNYYVSTTGSDSNAGTQASPWQTINHADAALVLGTNGAVVHVAPGTYAANVSLSRSGTSAGARITFVSDTKYGAIIASPSGAAVTVNGNWNDIQNFEIKGTGYTTTFGILFYGTNNRAIGNKIHDIYAQADCQNSGAAGIDVQNAATDTSAIGNILYNIKVTPVNPGTCIHNEGIYFAAPRGIIENNIVSGVADCAIHTWHAANSLVISNNTVFNSGSKTPAGNFIGGGIEIGSGDSGSTGTGINNTSVVNNIVYSNGGVGIWEIGAVGATNLYKNNIVNSNGLNYIWLSGSCPTCIDSNPLFVNYQTNGSGDYHLASGGSPAVNAGSTTCASGGLNPCTPTTDFSGRIRTSPIDIGAYEF
jgi:Right handed beta helix region